MLFKCFTRNGSRSALNKRKETVKNPLARDEREICGQLLGDGPRASDGPNLHQRVRRLDSVQLRFEYLVLDGVVSC